jgi:hypothetical protein
MYATLDIAVETFKNRSNFQSHQSQKWTTPNEHQARDLTGSPVSHLPCCLESQSQSKFDNTSAEEEMESFLSISVAATTQTLICDKSASVSRRRSGRSFAAGF